MALPWGATLPAGRQRVRGFAWSPAGRINRVEVSPDRGATWQPAAIREPNIPRALTRWDFEWDARPGEHAILTRAIDDQGNTQPARLRWNAPEVSAPDIKAIKVVSEQTATGFTFPNRPPTTSSTRWRQPTSSTRESQY